MILLIILNIIYASMFIFAKLGLLISKPLFMTGVRVIAGGIMSLLLYSATTFSWQSIRAITRPQWMLILLLSVINIYFSNMLEMWGLQYLSVGKTAFIYNLSPFFSALLAYIVFSEKMTMQKWLGLGLGFLGFMPMFVEPSYSVDATMSFGFLSLAEFALLCAALSSVAGWTLMRYLIEKTHLSIFFLNGMSMVGGGIFCCVHAFAYETQPFIYEGFEYTFLALVFVTALCKYLIAYNLNTYLLTKYTTTLITFFGFTSSLFAAFLGILFLQESLSWHLILSIAMVLTGLLIFYQEELKQGYIKT